MKENQKLDFHDGLLLYDVVNYITVRQVIFQSLVNRLDILDQRVSVVPGVALHQRLDELRGLDGQAVGGVILTFRERDDKLGHSNVHLLQFNRHSAIKYVFPNVCLNIFYLYKFQGKCNNGSVFDISSSVEFGLAD